MPGQMIEIDPQNYPKLDIQDGEDVTLKVMGKASVGEDGMIQITTDSIEQADVNPAKKTLREMNPSAMKRNQPMPEPDDTEDY